MRHAFGNTLYRPEWLVAVRKAIPSWIIQPFGWSQRRQTVEFVAWRPPSGASASRGSIVDVIVPVESVLERCVPLPSAATGHIRQIVDLHMRQNLAGNSRDYVWRIGSVERRGSSATVYVTKRSRIEELVRHIEAIGASLRTVALSGAPDVLFVDNRNKIDRPVHFWAAAAILAPMAILAFAVVQLTGETAEFRAEAEVLEAAKRDIIDQLKAAQEQQVAALDRRKEIDEWIDQLLVGGSRLNVLVSLSNVLPDSVWISELSLHGRDLRISGFSDGNVVDVVGSLQAELWTQAVQLEGPINVDARTGVSRFELSLRVGLVPE